MGREASAASVTSVVAKVVCCRSRHWCCTTAPLTYRECRGCAPPLHAEWGRLDASGDVLHSCVTDDPR